MKWYLQEKLGSQLRKLILDFQSKILENDTVTQNDTALTQPSNADEIRNDTTFDTGDTVTQMG